MSPSSTASASSSVSMSGRGKQPKLKPRQEAHLVELYRAGGHTTAELAELFGVARSTVYRAVHRTSPPSPQNVGV